MADDDETSGGQGTAEQAEAPAPVCSPDEWLHRTLGLNTASYPPAGPETPPPGNSGAGDAPASDNGAGGAPPSIDGGEGGAPAHGGSEQGGGEQGGGEQGGGEQGGGEQGGGEEGGAPAYGSGGEGGAPAYGEGGGEEGGAPAYGSGGEGGAPAYGEGGGEEGGAPAYGSGGEGGAPAYGEGGGEGNVPVQGGGEAGGEPAYGAGGEEGEPDNSGGGEGSGGGGEPETGEGPGPDAPPDSIPVSIDFTPPDVEGSSFGGRVKYKFKGKCTVKATIGPKKSDNSFGPEIGKSIVLKVSEQVWADKLTARLFGWDIVLTEKFKMEFSGGRKSVTAKAQYSVAAGPLSAQVAGTVFSYDFAKKEISALTLSITVIGSYDEPALEWEDHIIRDIKIEPKLGAEIAPNYLRILAESMIDELATVLTVEVGVLAGFLMGGVLTIGAAVLTIAQADQIAGLRGQCDALAGEMSQGFLAGASGQGAPSGSAAKVGYDLGRQNFERAKADLQQKNPGVPEDEVVRAIAERAGEATAGARQQIVNAARKAVWEAYAGSHEDGALHSYEKERWYAWSNIYGDDPRGDPEYARYRNQWTPGRLGM